MSIRVCILGSGSSGNSTYIESAAGALLVDAGLSCKETLRRLDEINADPGRIQAICVSHEHSDHTTGIRLLHKKFDIPIYANAGTIESLKRDEKFKTLPWQVFTTGTEFAAGDFNIDPFTVPHDAYDPVGFVVSAGSTRIGVVTDMGVATSLIRERLSRCEAVVIESNYDEQMLEDASRPWHLKQRIRGRQGHLSNEKAADMLIEIAGPQLQQVFLAHLSLDCNRGEIAVKTVRESLDGSGHNVVNVALTYAHRVSEVWSY